MTNNEFIFQRVPATRVDPWLLCHERGQSHRKNHQFSETVTIYSHLDQFLANTGIKHYSGKNQVSFI